MWDLGKVSVKRVNFRAVGGGGLSEGGGKAKATQGRDHPVLRVKPARGQHLGLPCHGEVEKGRDFR